MSQLFQLQLATENLDANAQQLGVSVSQLLAIQITVSATLIPQSTLQLYLNYEIQLPNQYLADQLTWPQWQQQQVKFTDYLWEQTCLECFIASELEPVANDTTTIEYPNSYIEINASPNGSYAVYEFNSYRQPSSLPPTPLLQPNSNQRANINWTTCAVSQSKLSIQSLLKSDSKLSIESSTVIYPCTSSDNPDYFYECGFSVGLDQLAMTATTEADATSFNHNIGLLHPCVILSFNKVALYFAPRHANPPDFHHRQYWTAFNP